jgi:hypothetical protein
MNRKQESTLHEQISLLLFPRIPHFSTYLNWGAVLGHDLAGPQKPREWYKHHITVVLDGLGLVQQSIICCLEIRTRIGSMNTEANHEFLAYYFETLEKMARKEKKASFHARP